MARINQTDKTLASLSDETIAQAGRLSTFFGLGSIDRAISYVVSRYHAAYLGDDSAVPPGWTLREDITQGDLEAYYEHYESEKGGNLWAERGRAIRAAVVAGWLTAPGGIEAVNALKPQEAAKLKNALDGLYIRLTTAHPN